MPALRWCGVWVAVTEPTDHAVEPPELCVLFEEDDFGAGAAGRAGGGEGGSAAADHDDVGLDAR